MEPISKLSTLLLSACALCSLATGAMAGTDGQDVYGGTFCQPRVSTAQVGYNTFGVHNKGSTMLTVECPMRVELYSRIHGVEVYTYDRHPSLNVSCILSIINGAGVTLWQKTLATAGYSPYVSRQLWFAQTTTLNKGTLHLSCQIPPPTSYGFSHITSYVLFEGI